MMARHLAARLVAPELRGFRGEAPLATMFWLRGVVASFWLIGLNLLALGNGNWLQVPIPVDPGYTAWILLSIWRCSANARPLCPTIARRMTIAWGLNTMFVLVFVEIELVLGRAAG